MQASIPLRPPGRISFWSYRSPVPGFRVRVSVTMKHEPRSRCSRRDNGRSVRKTQAGSTNRARTELVGASERGVGRGELAEARSTGRVGTHEALGHRLLEPRVDLQRRVLLFAAGQPADEQRLGAAVAGNLNAAGRSRGGGPLRRKLRLRGAGWLGASLHTRRLVNRSPLARRSLRRPSRSPRGDLGGSLGAAAVAGAGLIRDELY